MVTKARQLAEFIANADVDSDEIATGAVSASKLADTLDLSSKTIVMPDVAAFNITSGNVGIGTASPSANLHVENTTNASIRVKNTLNSASTSRHIELYNNDETGSLKLTVGRSGAGGGGAISTSNQMEFQTNGSERMRIDAAGNVGVGTTSPWNSISIADGTYPTLAIGSDANEMVYLQRNKVNGGDGYLYNKGSGSLILGTDNTRRVTINSTGNVGIGTTNPATLYGAYSTPLVVTDPTSGNLPYIEVRSSPSANQAGLIFNRSNTTGWLNALNNDGKLRIAPMASINQTGLTNAKDGSTGITIDTSGNVGIGTTSPGWKLDVYGEIASRASSPGLYLYDSNVTNLYHRIIGGGNAGIEYAADLNDVGAGYHRWDIGPNTRMFLSEAGNVGIGTTSPHDQLTITKSNSVAQLSLHRSGSNLSTSQGIGILNFDGIYNSAETLYGQVEVYSNNISGVRGSMDFRVKSTSGSMLTGLTLYGTNNGVVPIVGNVSNWGVTWDSRTPFQVNGGAVAHQTQSNGGSTIFSNNFYQNGGDRAISTGYSQGIVMNPNGSGAIRVLTTSGTNTAGNTFSYSQGPYVAAGGSSWANGSDERLKNITGEISNGLSKVATLRAAEYTWNDDEANKPQVGLIAQDVQAVLPEVVTSIQMHEGDDTEYLGIAYDQVIPLLVAALKEAKEKIETLESRVDALEG